jgi:small subunit ribosomal protein S5e
MDQQAEEVKNQYACEFKLFNKYDYSDVKVDDICFKDYIAVTNSKSQVFVPHTAGRYQVKRFRKAQCPIVERLVGCMMFHGRNAGKKAQAIRIVKHTFAIIQLMTGENPIQVLVKAAQVGAAREDSTRIGGGGAVRRQAVDVAPMRRASVALFNMAIGARNASFRTMKTISECLADEIMNCAKETGTSYAIKKKDEIEKVAKGNR